MRRLLIIALAALLLAVSLLVALAIRQPTTASAPSPPPTLLTQVQVTVPAHGQIRITLEPGQAVADPDPALILQVDLVDKQTGRPVRGDVVLETVPVEDFVADYDCRWGQVVYAGVSQFSLGIPSRTDVVACLAVRAVGYETWVMGYRFRLEHSRVVDFTIEMEPASETIDLHLLITDGQRPVTATVRLERPDTGGDFEIGPLANATLPIPADGQPFTLTITAPGFLGWSQVFTPTKSFDLVVRLIEVQQ